MSLKNKCLTGSAGNIKAKFDEMLKMFVSPISFLVGNFAVTLAA